MLSMNRISRPNIAVLGCLVALIALALTTALADTWLDRFVEPDLGVGIVVVGAFFALLFAIAAALLWSTAASALAWRAGKQRGVLDRAILASGTVVSLALCLYLAACVVA